MCRRTPYNGYGFSPWLLWTFWFQIQCLSCGQPACRSTGRSKGPHGCAGASQQLLFFGLLKGQFDLLLGQCHQIFVDALQDEVHICPCHGNAAGQGFFCRSRCRCGVLSKTPAGCPCGKGLRTEQNPLLHFWTFGILNRIPLYHRISKSDRASATLGER